MAIKPRGNKVTGTKKKDKIIWANSKAWKKSLTVNAGAGNDTIDFSKSKYKNKLNGEKGNDFIIGGKKADTINGGAGNDKITGGKGNDVIYTDKGKDIIYINKGDGKDTIYHQGSKTTIQINGANKKDKVANFVKQGNDLILTYQRKGVKLNKSEIITIKNYFNNDGTIKASSNNIYLKNKKNQKISALLKKQGMSLKNTGNKILGSYLNDTITGNNSINYIDGGAGNDIITVNTDNNTIYGGAGNDIITVNTDNNTIYGGAGNDIINANSNKNKIYGGDGSDTINVKGSDFYINTGKGDDTVNLADLGNGNKSTGTIVANLYEGNTYINGIENVKSDTGSYGLILQSNGLWHNFRDYKYMLSSFNGDDLIISLTSGEAIFIKDFNKLEYSNQLYSLAYMDNKPYSIYARARDNAPEVNYIAASTYTTSQWDTFNVATGENNISQTVNINNLGTHFWFDGAKGATVNINSMENHVYLSEKLDFGEHNEVNISNGYNEIKVNSNSMVTLSNSDNCKNNKIYITESSSATTILNKSTQANKFYIYGRFNNLQSSGNDEVHFVGNSNKFPAGNELNVECYNAGNKDIYIDSADYSKLKVSVAEYTGTTNIVYNYADNVDLVFTHPKGTSTVNIKENPVYKPSDRPETTLASFYESGINKIKVQAGKNATAVTLAGMTQLVEMSKISHTCDFSDKASSGLYDKNNRGSALLWSYSTHNDSYLGYNSQEGGDGRVIIKDEGGTDLFKINEVADGNNFRFFFDVDKNGTVVGKDLYIFSILEDDNSPLRDFIQDTMYQSTVDCVCFKDFFNGTNGGKGKGFIETIQDKNGNTCNTMGLINSIKQDVASWLNSYGADTVMEAIENNIGNRTKLYNQYTTANSINGNNNYWANYWSN